MLRIDETTWRCLAPNIDPKVPIFASWDDPHPERETPRTFGFCGDQAGQYIAQTRVSLARKSTMGRQDGFTGRLPLYSLVELQRENGVVIGEYVVYGVHQGESAGFSHN